MIKCYKQTIYYKQVLIFAATDKLTEGLLHLTFRRKQITVIVENK